MGQGVRDHCEQCCKDGFCPSVAVTPLGVFDIDLDRWPDALQAEEDRLLERGPSLIANDPEEIPE
jgi:hypothetical protein